MDAKQLLEEALRLPDAERAALAGELIQSLDPKADDDAEAVWSAEIRARLERIGAGTATTISSAEARRRIRAAAGPRRRSLIAAGGANNACMGAMDRITVNPDVCRAVRVFEVFASA